MKPTEPKTIDDLVAEVMRLVMHDVFDDIMDADTADTYSLIHTFRRVRPDLWQEAVNLAIDMAMEEGATEERIAISGYEKV